MDSSHRLFVSFLWALCLIAQAGCAPPPPVEGGWPVADTGTTDTAVQETIAQPQLVPGVTMGTHAQFKQQTTAFVPLFDDSELPIVLGHQGAWMVVLALRNYQILQGPLDIVARIEAAGSVQAELALVDLDLDPKLDRYEYIYDIWVIVSDPSLSTYPAIATLEIRDRTGAEVTLQHEVILSGGLD
jgi:hypothetical protein